jgi:phage terminase large subunit-like protein
MDKASKLRFLKRADETLIHFALAFFPDAFTDEFCPAIHYPLVEVIDAPTPLSRQKAGAAPRGTGKSTLGNTVNIIRRALMRRNKYILIVSYTLDQAKEHLKAIRLQLEGNQKILDVFGDMQGDTWNEEVLILKNGVKIKAIGAGSKVRGRREGFDRPDYVLLDDFEDRESIESETITARMLRWWSSDLRNSMNKHHAEELFLGTILGDNALLEGQLQNEDCLSVRLELFDDKYQSHWPKVYSNERIDQMRRQAEREGTLNELWADYRNIAIAGENQKFKPEHFKEWSKEFHWANVPRFLIVDPARTTKARSDCTAICAVGLPYYGDVFVLDYTTERKTNEDIYEVIYDFCVRYMINWIYVETNGLEDYILKPLQNYLRRKGMIVYIEGIHAPNNMSKEDRILGSLIPLYRSGAMYHNPNKKDELESTLLRYPKVKHDDLPDVLAYVTKIMGDRNIGKNPTPDSVYVGDPDLLNRSAI